MHIRICSSSPPQAQNCVDPPLMQSETWKEGFPLLKIEIKAMSGVKGERELVQQKKQNAKKNKK